ncbi:hypothetical protein VNO80_10218 [Phaseolus coccineus]|uniref:Thionin-like protein n=1 Tax=Phaseolus coccineus TaxID=3886 RepID=A0AAN9REG3_PHACN
MAVKGMKTFGIMIMIIIMPILSQAYNDPRSSEIKPNGAVKCGAKCLIQCLPKIENKFLYSVCLVSCYAACHKISLDLAYDCVNGCDSVKSIDVNFGNRQVVVNAMDSCMQGCKKKKEQ